MTVCKLLSTGSGNLGLQPKTQSSNFSPHTPFTLVIFYHQLNIMVKSDWFTHNLFITNIWTRSSAIAV